MVVATLGGEEEGAARELTGKRKRGDELAHQPVRHSLWEQGSLEAHKKQIRKMVKKGKKKKIVVANGSAAGGEGEDGSGATFAAQGMGLEAPTAGAAGGSGEETMSAEALGPPAHSMLADVVPQPAEADPSSEGAPTGGETDTAGPTLEQHGDTARATFARDGRVKKAAAMQDAGDERRMRRLLLGRIGAPAEGAEERTGLGTGYGVFDALYMPLAGDPRMVRYGRNYSDKGRWTEEVAQDWESRYSALKDQWGCQNVTVRLFKVNWQGQEMSRDAVVRVLQQVLEPIGDVQGELAVYAEMYDSKGVRANEDEQVLGTGGGVYLPVVMRNLANNVESQKKTQWLETWGGVKPVG